MTSKEFKAYLILDWKSGSITIKKFKPKNVKPFEIPFRLDLKVKIPEPKEHSIVGEIDIPEEKAHRIVLSSLGD